MKEKELKEKVKTILTEGDEVFLSKSEKEVYKTGQTIAPSENLKLIASGFICTVAIIIAVVWGISLNNSTTPAGPWGELASPHAGETTGTEVSVIGETRNIEPGQHIWLAVDKPQKGLCWPKIRTEANT